MTVSLLHESQHFGVLPPEQTGGGAEACEALLYFVCVHRTIVRERHDTVAKGKTTLAFRAFPRCLQVFGDDEVFGMQRVKHHNLRKSEL